MAILLKEIMGRLGHKKTSENDKTSGICVAAKKRVDLLHYKLIGKFSQLVHFHWTFQNHKKLLESGQIHIKIII
jgi:hypothetical protein